MFRQLLTPVADNLAASVVVGAIPIAVVLVLMGGLRRPAWQAALAGLAVALVLAVTIWKMPAAMALESVAAGAVFALWPVMWIVVNALLLYNIAVRSGRFDALRRWVLQHLPDDQRVVLLVIGFCFGALLEGVAGFGAPVAITSALLIAFGLPPIQAITFTLIFNTAPVAFGALGAPITTLAAVTQLPVADLASMVGRQLPFMALLLPFYVIALYGGLKSLRALWPVLLVAGLSFGLAQFAASNFLSYELTDVLSSISSLLGTLAFLRFWKPAYDPEYALDRDAVHSALVQDQAGQPAAWQGWLPWFTVALVVLVWTTAKLNLLGEMKVAWPGLHNDVFITLYGKPYAAVWSWQPLATGTSILFASAVTALLVGLRPREVLAAARDTWIQGRLAILTVMLIIGLAYLLNYSGIAYTLGLGAASAGAFFPILSAFLGWLAVFLSGSDTSGNALFGNLQVVAARQLGLHPVLIAATNSTGGVMGKMISPQNIATGVAVTDLKGREGEVLRRTFKHSIILTLLLGLLVLAQQYLFPWMIPG